MNILYCYKLDKDTGEINRYEVSDYKIEKLKSGDNYIFTHALGNKASSKVRVPISELDKMRQKTFYTHNPDPSYALVNIRKYYQDKIQDLGFQMDKAIKTLNLIDKKALNWRN